MNLSHLFQTIYGLFHPTHTPNQDQLNQANQQAINQVQWQPGTPAPTGTPTPPAPPTATPVAQQAVATLRPRNQAAQPTPSAVPLAHIPVPDLSKVAAMSPNYPAVIRTAYNVAKQNGLPPAALIGQLAAEGRGTSKYAQDRNNYLSIGAYTKNPDQAFSYANPRANLQAYADLIKTDPRYAKAYAARANPTQFVREVAKNYATDPNYFNNVTNSPEFRFYNQAPQ